MGLREMKKNRTRQLIADTAWRLFADRGFDRVTIADVAREAEVAEATIRNYFASKEDLFYGRLEAFGTQMVEAIGRRKAGEPVLVAFQRFLLAPGGLLTQVEAGDEQALRRLRTVNRLIADSKALRAREQRALAGYADALAALLAAETGAPPDDVRARVVANALLGIHRALLEYVRQRVLADDHPARLAADARAHLRDACALLEHGIGGYGADG
jgi:AcrR family transcriptional regulator